MPYVRCASCGVLSYTLRSELEARCLECGVPLVRAAADTDPNRRLDTLVRLTRDLLDTDVAILSEIRDGREIAQRVAGEWSSLVSLQHASVPLEDTFCQRLLDGRIGHYIRDAQTDDRVRHLRLTRELGIRAWLGVSIRPSDSELYVLCCLAREARPNLDERDVQLLRGLAESILAELQTVGSESSSLT